MTDSISVPVPSVKYAGFWVRLVAFVVDSVFISISSFIVAFIIGIILGIILASSGSFITQGGPVFQLMSDLISILIIWTYFVLMTYYCGATLGKMLVGIRVESDSFQKLSFGRILLRETVGKLVSAIIFCIGYIMVAFTGKKQALHDMFAKSVVVYKNPAKPHSAGLIVATIVVIVFLGLGILGTLSAIVLTSLSSARQDAQNAQAQYQQSQAQIQTEVQSPAVPSSPTPY